VPGVLERRKLAGISLKIGLGPSVRYLKKQRGLLGRLAVAGCYRPDHLVEALSPFVGDPARGIRGFHFNTFNRTEETERWRRETTAAFDTDEGW
jgi:methylenetetrahydrofolate reductase (NADPH)